MQRLYSELSGNFADPCMKTIISETVNSFYLNEVLCDVTLVTNTITIRAHKLILAAVSPYFRAQFDFLENENSDLTVNLPYDGEDIKNIINYIYTGTISISRNNIFLIMELQDFFQIASLRFLCSHYLRSLIDQETVWSIKREAECYRYVDVAETANSYISSEFRLLLKKSSFFDVPYDLLMECLSSEYLAVPIEDELLFHLGQWLVHNPEERLKHLDTLLTKVDVTAIQQWNVTKEKVLNLFKDTDKTRITLWYELATKRRHEEEPGEINRYKESAPQVLLAIGGLNMSGSPVPTVDCIKSLEEPWKPTLRLSKSGKGMQTSSMVIPVMHYARVAPAVTSTEKEVYVLGGTYTGRELEVYRLSENAWDVLTLFPVEMIVEPSLAVMDGSLYCSGGMYLNEQKRVTNETWVLHANSKSWIKLSPMKSARFYHYLVASCGCLYGIGGLSEVCDPVTTVEKYEPILDMWFEISVLPLSMPYAACSVPINHHILSFCGDSLFSFDTLKNSWCILHTVNQENGRTDDLHSRIYCIKRGNNIIKSTDNFNSLLVYSLSTGFATEWPNQRKPHTALSSIKVPLYNPPHL